MVTMDPVNSAATSFNNTIVTQLALNVLSALELYAYRNVENACVTNNSFYDFIIVGGGTSGCVLANRLSEDYNTTVLLIEAGTDFNIENQIPTLLPFNKRTRFDWNYTTLPDKFMGQCHQSISFMPTVGKVLGGDSSVDFMLYSQGEDNNFNEWADLTNEPSWKYENVLRLYKKMERFEDKLLQNSPDSVYHGFNGNVGLTKDRSAVNNKFYKAFQEVGFQVVADINNRTRQGFTGAVYYIDGERQNSALAYLGPIKNRTNLFVIKNTQVTQILFNKKNNVVGVKAVTLDNNKIFIFKARKEVIVTCGTFNTPKLLQLSGIGPKKVLGKFKIPMISELPVGLNYGNHIAAPVVYAMKKTCRPFIPENFNPNKYPVPTFVGYNYLNDSCSQYRTVSFNVPYTPQNLLLQYTSFVYRYKYDICDSWFNQTKGRELLYTLVENGRPVSRGWVQIRSTNPFDAPDIKTGYLTNYNDVEDLISYVKDFLRVLQSKYFKKVGALFIDPTNGRCGEFDIDNDKYWKCYVYCLMAPLSHHSGTAALGSVVDGRLRVFGVTGLRVADASIMPNPMPGSITIPTMMISENAAEMIKEDWKGK